MIAEILAVGTELLLGDITNTNAQFLARELSSLGIGLMHQTVVGDNAERLRDAARLALSRSDILITTGGLGPTADDLTRETISGLLDLRLVLDEASLQHMKEIFSKTHRDMVESNRKQAMLPEGAAIFANDFGTAPGCAVKKDGKVVIMLPGPPREMEPMFANKVRPYLARFSDSVIRSVNLRIYGIGESNLQEMLGDLMNGENPTLSPYAKDGEVLLRVTARAADEDAALELCRPLVEEVKRRTGSCCYGTDIESLEQAVVEALHAQGKKISAAESCTGGLFCQRITSIPGASEVFECGAVTYSNAVKSSLLGVQADTLKAFGAVSRETACEMAEGVRRLAGADIGVGITGIAGPGGGTAEKPVGLVYTAVSDGVRCYAQRLTLGRGVDERAFIRFLSASAALDMVRRLLAHLPQNEGVETVFVLPARSNAEQR